MRLKLKSDTFFIPMGESIYLRNNEKSLAIKGKTLANWLERLTPALDGQHDLTDICQTIPENKRTLLEQFLLTLVEHGYLKDTTNDITHNLSVETVAIYGPAITFIDSHTDSGAYRFQRFLTTPVLAIASGECLLALAHALLETGNRAISLLDTGEETTSYGRLQELLSVLQERDPDVQLTLLNNALWHNQDDLRSLCASTSTVLYFSTEQATEHVARLAGYCRTTGVSFLPAIALQNEIHIGPYQHADSAGCWQCYWRRYQAARGLPAYTAEGQIMNPVVTGAAHTGKPAIGIVANMLAFEFFKHGTHVRKNTLEDMVRVLELERLQIVKHQLFPHPQCTLCAPQASSQPGCLAVVEDVTRLLQTTDIHQDEPQIEKFIDSNSGIFTQINDMDYHQLPLIRSQIEVPLASLTAYALPVIKAAGLDYKEVQMRMMRQATARYLESLADARPTCRGTYQQFQKEAVSPVALSGWLHHSPQINKAELAWVWGVQITPSFDFTPLLLPGAAITPYSYWNRQHNDLLFQPEAGITSVTASWQRGLAEGIAELSLTLVQAPETDQPGIPLEALIAREAYSYDPLCAAYLAMLDTLNVRAMLLDCAVIAGIPCVALYVNERYIGLSAHWNTICAVRQALERAVLVIQIERTPGPGERNEFPQESKATEAQILKGISVSTRLRPSLAEENNYTTAWQSLATCLRGQRWDIVVAPLPNDATLERLLPCALRLLAVRQGSDGTL
jgi:bacteriocin biosynthesis cyclodehydratase domain-containing protein